ARSRFRVGGGGEVAGGKGFIGVVVVVTGEADLLEIVGTLDAGGGLPHALNRWKQQADEHGNNSDHDQKLDKRETGPLATHPQLLGRPGKPPGRRRTQQRVCQRLVVAETTIIVWWPRKTS